MISVIVRKALEKIYTKYIVALLLSIAVRKTCTQMANHLNIGHDMLTQALKAISKDEEGIFDGLVKAAQKLLDGSKKWWFVVDDTMLLKPHTKKLLQAIYDRCGATGKVEKGMVAVVIAITDGTITIPVAYKLWINRKNSDPEQYQKKWEIALDLIKQLMSKIRCDGILADGAFANRFCIAQLNELHLDFEMRFRKNGKIGVGTKKQYISDLLAPLIKGPRKYATMHGIWQNLPLFFTAHKHKNKSGEYIITYTVSNREVSAKEHALDYCLRWGIEMFFRTAKQSLGIQHCASPNIQMQIAHINACFVSYAVLQERRIKQKLRSPEEALYSFRDHYFKHAKPYESPANQFNQLFA